MNKHLIEQTKPGLGRRAALVALAVLTAGVVTLPAGASLAKDGVVIPAPALDETAKSGTATAIFAGGCFWGVQGVFQHVSGVVSATSGYAGGTVANPSYEMVGSGNTGHAEAVQIVYHPAEVTYGHLLQIFFSVVADPTTLNYQGPDRGTQYRTAIFPTNAEQKAIAKAYIAQLDMAKVFRAPIVTAIEANASFYRAEDYHQDFLALNPTYPYITYVDLPKVAALQKIFPATYRAEPVLVMH